MPTSIAGLEESHTKTLRIDDLESGAIIYSHDLESGLLANTSSTILGQNYYAHYPLAFSCEVVVHAPLDNGRIMLTIESFFIPSSDQTCKDDFLYVFDSNTARSKAMVGIYIYLMAFCCLTPPPFAPFLLLSLTPVMIKYPHGYIIY